MGIFDKIKGLAGDNSDKVKEGLDKAGDMIDEKTGGEHTDKIDTATDKIGDMLDDMTEDSGTE